MCCDRCILRSNLLHIIYRDLLLGDHKGPGLSASFQGLLTRVALWCVLSTSCAVRVGLCCLGKIASVTRTSDNGMHATWDVQSQEP